MGEKIKTLGRLTMKEVSYDVELNHPASGVGEKEVHIQSSKFRAEMTESEFVQFAAAVTLAEKKLRMYKKL